MNDSNDMITYRKRRVKIGKNTKLYGSILYISINDIFADCRRCRDYALVSLP